jgi:hypothetical protein
MSRKKAMANKRLQRDLARAPQFQHTCPLLWFGCFRNVRPSGHGAGKAAETRRSAVYRIHE